MSVSATAIKTKRFTTKVAWRRLATAGLIWGLSALDWLLVAADGYLRAHFNLVDPAIGPFPAD